MKVAQPGPEWLVRIELIDKRRFLPCPGCGQAMHPEDMRDEHGHSRWYESDPLACDCGTVSAVRVVDGGMDVREIDPETGDAL